MCLGMIGMSQLSVLVDFIAFIQYKILNCYLHFLLF